MANKVLYGSAALSTVQPLNLSTCGLQSVTSIYSASETLSASMTIRMAKIPDGARVVEVILNQIDAAAASNGEVSVGTPGDHDLFIVSASANATITRINTATGSGTVLDVSDDTAAANPYTWLQIDCKTSTTGTASAVITLTVIYETSRGY